MTTVEREPATRPNAPIGAVALHIARTLTGYVAELDDPVERYAWRVYWRMVFEAAAEEMTVQSGCELMDLRLSGSKAPEIHRMLTEAGFSISPSGVRHLLELAQQSTRTAPNVQPE